MQDLIEAAKNDDITTVEHILQKGENIRSIIDTRESDKVNSEGWEPLWAKWRAGTILISLIFKIWG